MEYIYLGGCDVGIKNLTFCFARIPFSSNLPILDTIEITEMSLINLFQQNENEQTDLPTCAKLCKGKVSWYNPITNEPFCSRHTPDHLWKYSPTPITRIKPKKRNRNQHQIEDSDNEQPPQTPTPTATLSPKKEKSIQCGQCHRDMTTTRYHRLIAFPIEKFKGYRYLPLCMKCQRNPMEGIIWPPQHIISNPNTPLQGPNMTETEVIMNNLVQILHDKYQNCEIDCMFIENQPTMMNPRMKSIQMILYAFFQSKIRKQNGGRCMFVSPNLKWKMNMPDIPEQATYREHKQESVRTFLNWISKRKETRWLELVEGEKKRDDLCDAFWLMISGWTNWKISILPIEDDDTTNSLSGGEMG